MTDYKKAALGYASLGLRVFPIKPDAKAPPLVKDWPNEASTDPKLIDSWWNGSPDANIGIACGEGSGVFVLDIDGAEGAATAAALPYELPKASCVRTPNGGYHVYMQWPEGGARNSVRSLGAGLDTRGEAGYVLAPPSVVDGKPYTWVGDKWSAPQPAPAELVKAVQQLAASTAAATPLADGEPWPEGEHDTRLRAASVQAFRGGMVDQMARELFVRALIATHCPTPPGREPFDDASVSRLARPPQDAADRTLGAIAAQVPVDQVSDSRFSMLHGVDRKVAIPYGGRLNIPLGTVSILTGQQGTGKGLLEVLEITTLTQAGYGVIIASDEDSIAHTIKPRLVAAGADLDHIHMVDSLKLPDDSRLIAEHAIEHGVRLVVVDPWTNHLGDIDVNDNAIVRAALMALKESAEVGGFSVILSAHPNKNSAVADPLERIAHASALTQVARSAFWLVRDPRPQEGGVMAAHHGQRLLLAQVKANLTRFADTELYEIETRQLTDPDQEVPVLAWRWTCELPWLEIHKLARQAESSRAPAKADAMEWLVEYLREHGPTPYAEVVEVSDHSLATLKRARLDAIDLGHMVAGRRGEPWQLVTVAPDPDPF